MDCIYAVVNISENKNFISLCMLTFALTVVVQILTLTFGVIVSQLLVIEELRMHTFPLALGVA